MLEKKFKKIANPALKEFVENFDILNALADYNRMKIVILLFDNLKTGLTVTSITNQMTITQPAVSHHLKILRDAGVVAFRKEGLQSYYYLTLEEPLESIEEKSKTLRAELENKE